MFTDLRLYFPRVSDRSSGTYELINSAEIVDCSRVESSYGFLAIFFCFSINASAKDHALFV